MKLHLIDDIGNWWKFWSTRVLMIQAALNGWLAIDPTGMLNAWNMMPADVRAILPGRFVSTVGGLLFGLNMLTIALRAIKQKKLANG